MHLKPQQQVIDQSLSARMHIVLVCTQTNLSSRQTPSSSTRSMHAVCTGTSGCSSQSVSSQNTGTQHSALMHSSGVMPANARGTKGVLSSLAKTVRCEGSLCRVGPAVCASRAPTFRLSRCSALLSSGSCCALPTLRLLPVPALPLQCTPASHYACRAPAVHLHLAQQNKST